MVTVARLHLILHRALIPVQFENDRPPSRPDGELERMGRSTKSAPNGSSAIESLLACVEVYELRNPASDAGAMVKKQSRDGVEEGTIARTGGGFPMRYFKCALYRNSHMSEDILSSPMDYRNKNGRFLSRCLHLSFGGYLLQLDSKCHQIISGSIAFLRKPEAPFSGFLETSHQFEPRSRSVFLRPPQAGISSRSAAHNAQTIKMVTILCAFEKASTT
jgi:hypothetical protein